MTRGGLETVSTESGTEGSNPALSSEASSAKPRNFAQPVQSPGEGRLLRPKGNAVAVIVVDDTETPLSFESGGAGSAAHLWAAVRPPLACRSSCAGSARGAWSPSPAPPDAPSRQEAPASPVSAECSTQGPATVYARVTRRRPRRTKMKDPILLIECDLRHIRRDRVPVG
jgi:hypothetical protein